MGVNSLPETVTRQRRGCDLNPGPTAPESSTLTTRLSSHPCGYVCVKDDRECIIYSHSSHFYTVSSHSFPLPFPSLCPIPIPIGFPLGYFHSHLIPKPAQQNNIGLVLYIPNQSTVELQINSFTQNWTSIVEK